MISDSADVGRLHSASSSRQAAPVDATCPDRHKHAAGAGAPRRFTAVGRASPFQKAGRSGKSPVPAFAVKIINKSPGMAAHDDEQQQQLPPPLHPSSWKHWAGGRTVRRRKGGRENQPSSKFPEKAWLQVPHFFKTPPAGAAAFVVGKKGETSRRPGSCFTILVAPPVSALVSFWGVVFNFMP